jgi:hypothetical protein
VVGLRDRIAGNTRCAPHRAILPCARCDSATYKSRQMADEKIETVGPRASRKVLKTGNKIDNRGITWCGRCDARVISGTCMNARCSSNRK